MTIIRHVFIGTIGCILLSGCGGGNSNKSDPVSESSAASPDSEATCESDTDCVRGECCHPRTCVHSSRKPGCDDVMCTMDCMEDTMDCGAGACTCKDGSCTVEWLVE